MKRKAVIAGCLCFIISVLLGFLYLFSGYNDLKIINTNYPNLIGQKNDKSILLLSHFNYKDKKILGKSKYNTIERNTIITMGDILKSDDLASETKYKYINVYSKDGEYICGLNNTILSFRDKRYIILYDGNQSIVIDSQLEKIIKNYDYRIVALLPRSKDNYYFIIDKEGKSGIVDQNDNIIVPNIYYNIQKIIDTSKVKNGYNLKSKDDYNIMLKLNKGNKYGLCNQDGKMIAPVEYDEVENISFYNKDDKVNIHIKLKKDDEEIVVDSNGKQIDLYNKYDYVRQYGNNLYCIGNENKYGVATLNNKIIVPIGYDSITIKNDNTLIIAIQNVNDYKIIYFFDTNGDLISSIKYENFRFINENLALVMDNNKYGVITINNRKEVIPIEYDCIHSGYLDILHSKDFFTLQNGKPELGNATYGVATKEGKVILETEYDSINYFELNDLISARKNSKGYLFDKNGNVLIDGFRGNILNIFTNKDRYYAIISNSWNKQKYKDITKEVLGQS